MNRVHSASVPCSLAFLWAFFLGSESLWAQAEAHLAPPQAQANGILSVPGEELIPAALGVRTDPKGNPWNVERTGSLGRVGSTLVNSGLVLSINQQKFETFQPRMTRDGKEFVIHGVALPGLGGIQVSRRVRFVDETSSLRYLELFFNGTANPVTLDIELATSFSGNYKSALTNRAAIDPSILKEGESGVLVIPESTQANRAFLFVLCGSSAPDKPTISSQNRYALTFQYQITLQPGETRGIEHVVAQVIVPGEMDRQSLAKLFAPYSLSGAADRIPEGFQDKIVNRSPVDSGTGLNLESYTLASLGLEPLDADVLAMGEETRLFGKANLSDLEIETDYGPVRIPADQIAGVSGKNRGERDRVRVYLHDGQVLGGTVAPEAEMSFDAKGSGVLKLNYEKLDRLALLAPKNTAPPQGIFAQTWSGDRLRLEGKGQPVLTGVTPWGYLPFSLEELRWLAPAPDDQPGYRLRLQNGTDCFLLLDDRALNFGGGLLAGKALQSKQIHSIVPLRKTGNKFGAPVLLFLRGNQKTAGTFASEQLTFRSGGQLIPAPVSRIRSCRRASQGQESFESPLFEVEMIDGSRILGRLEGLELGLPFLVLNEKWNVPLEDIVALEADSPAIDEESRALVTGLIVKLGDDDWAVREKATQDLTKVGNKALAMMKREMVQNPDPEIRRRLENILAGFRPF